jgi:hypothetical protein
VNPFVQRHRPLVTGLLSGFDRLRLRGTLRTLAHTGGFAHYLHAIGVKIRDLHRYVRGVTQTLKHATEDLARRAGRPLVYLDSPAQPKEDIALQIAQEDGIQSGLIAVLSCVESCRSYTLRGVGTPELRGSTRKCLHYYHYYLDPDWGLMHVRLQSWLPLSIQVVLNGRDWLARQMYQRGLGYTRADNCFTALEDPRRAQALMDRLLRRDWPRLLNGLARRVNPAHPRIFAAYPQHYYWSVDQSEWATDVMFEDPQDLARLYPDLLRHAMLCLGSTDVLRFLDRPVTAAGWPYAQYQGRVTTDLRQWVEGVRIKHWVGKNSIKMYNKAGSVLRIETTLNQPGDFKVFRCPEGQPQAPPRWLPLRKGVADIVRRAQVCQACNERYLGVAATAHHPRPLGQLLTPLCRPVTWAPSRSQAKPRRSRALNPLAAEDLDLLRAVHRGEFILCGFRNRDLCGLLYPASNPDKALRRRRAARVTRQIRLLRAHGLVRKIPSTHRYQVTDKGRLAIAALLTAEAADIAKLAA